MMKIKLIVLFILALGQSVVIAQKKAHPLLKKVTILTTYHNLSYDNTYDTIIQHYDTTGSLIPNDKYYSSIGTIISLDSIQIKKVNKYTSLKTNYWSDSTVTEHYTQLYSDSIICFRVNQKDTFGIEKIHFYKKRKRKFDSYQFCYITYGYGFIPYKIVVFYEKAPLLLSKNAKIIVQKDIDSPSDTFKIITKPLLKTQTLRIYDNNLDKWIDKKKMISRRRKTISTTQMYNSYYKEYYETMHIITRNKFGRTLSFKKYGPYLTLEQETRYLYEYH